MASIPYRQLPLEQLEKLLQENGQLFEGSDRRALLEAVVEKRTALVESATPTLYDPMMGVLAASVDNAQDYAKLPLSCDQHECTFAPWAADFIEKLTAAKEVLTFFQAQHNMDLFSGNEHAKRLYTRIISAGMAEVLYNNKRYRQ